MNNDETGQDCRLYWTGLACSAMKSSARLHRLSGLPGSGQAWGAWSDSCQWQHPGSLILSLLPSSSSAAVTHNKHTCHSVPVSHTTNIPVTVSHTTNYLIVVFLNFLNSRKISADENYFLFSEQNCSEAQKVTHIYWRGWAANLKPSRNNQVSLAGVWTGRSPPRTWTVWERPSHYLMLTGQKKLLEKNLAR